MLCALPSAQPSVCCVPRTWCKYPLRWGPRSLCGRRGYWGTEFSSLPRGYLERNRLTLGPPFFTTVSSRLTAGTLVLPLGKHPRAYKMVFPLDTEPCGFSLGGGEKDREGHGKGMSGLSIGSGLARVQNADRCLDTVCISGQSGGMDCWRFDW